MVKKFELNFELKFSKNLKKKTFDQLLMASPIMEEFLILNHVSILLILEVMAIWKL